MKLKACKYIVFFCFLSLSLFSQQEISGIVVQDSDGQPHAQAEIFLQEINSWTKTNARGMFSFTDVKKGNYTLFVLADGYKVRERTITVGEKDLSLEIRLRALSVNLPQVEVQDQNEQIFSLKRLRSVEGMGIYAGKKTEVIALDNLTANLAANNTRQIYNQVAGLNIYETGDAGLQLNIGGRGLDPNRSASFNIRQNGYDISADVLGYPESYYTPPAEALQEIQIIRGAASLQYGTQFGGLVNFVFKKPHPEKNIELISRQTAGSYGLFTSFNSISGTKDNFSYYAYFNYKKGNGFRDNSGFESKNLYTHLAYALDETSSVEFEYTHLTYLARQAGGLTDAQFYENPDFSNRSRNWFEVNWNLFSLKYKKRFSPKTNFTVNAFGLDAARNAVGFRTNRVSQTDDPEAPRDLLKGTFQNWGVESRLLHRYSLGNQMSVLLLGAKYYQSRNTSIQGPGSASDEADFTLADEAFSQYPNQSDFVFPNINIAAFGENIFYLSEQLSITPGFRLEYIKTESEGTYRKIDFDLAGNPIRDQTFTDNRLLDRKFLLLGLGLSYRMQPKTELFANISQNYRSVTFNDIRVVNPSFQVDPDISDENGFTADLGIRGSMKRVSYNLGGFSMLYNDRLGEVLRVEKRPNAEGEMVETGRIVRYRGNIGRAFIYGLEGLVDWNFLRKEVKQDGHLRANYFLNLSLTQSEYLDSEINGVTGNEVEFIPHVNIKTGLYTKWDDLRFSFQYTWLSSQFTDASNAPQNKADNQSGIVGEIPSYGIVDVSTSYTIKRFTLETGVNNLLNNTYFTRRATGYPGPGIIPAQPRTIYVTLQVKI